jgi:D-glycero-D-manno-heptose 1,7-bisphosphate phosphatase
VTTGSAKQRPAIFLDRDGTVVEPRHYPRRPHELRIYPGVAPELRLLQDSGFALVLVTNQSGLARGLFQKPDLERMHHYLREELSSSGVKLDGIYYCPYHPDGIVPNLAVACGCRKPQPGMLLNAADDLQLDLLSSWFVGDILDDIEAGHRAGCRTVLVDLGTEPEPRRHDRTPDYVAPNTVEALRIVRWLESDGPPAALDYRPQSWVRRTRPLGFSVANHA